MKKIFILLIVFISIQSSSAALAPDSRCLQDLDVMVAYIKSHPLVAASLESIDCLSYVIYFGDNCEVVFKRKSRSLFSRLFESQMPGPMPDIEFASANCPVE